MTGKGWLGQHFNEIKTQDKRYGQNGQVQFYSRRVKYSIWVGYCTVAKEGRATVFSEVPVRSKFR